MFLPPWLLSIICSGRLNLLSVLTLGPAAAKQDVGRLAHSWVSVTSCEQVWLAGLVHNTNFRHNTKINFSKAHLHKPRKFGKKPRSTWAWCHKLAVVLKCLNISYDSKPVTITEKSTSFLEVWARTMRLDHRGTRSVFLVGASAVNMTNMSQNSVITWNISHLKKYSRTFQKIWHVLPSLFSSHLQRKYSK